MIRSMSGEIKMFFWQSMGRSWFTNFLAFCTGILLSYYHFWPLLIPALVSVFIIGRVSRHYRDQVVAAGLFLLLGSGYYVLHAPEPVGQQPENPVIDVKGKVEGYPRTQDNRTSFSIATGEKDEHRQHFQVSCNFPLQANPGDRVIIRGTLKLPAGPGNPGEFDYPRYLRNQHIFYLLQVEDPQDIRLTPGTNVFTRFANDLRDSIVKQTNQILPEEQAALVLGMLLGKVDQMDDRVYQDFQKTGLVHIFAVSGLNVGFIVLFIAALAGLFHLSRPLAFYLALFSVLLYSSLTGWPVSVQRAVIMGILSLVAVYMGRSNQPINGLGLAGLLILIIEPCALFGVSFQLSFLATWGLVHLYTAVKQYLHYNSPWWDLFWIPVCAGAAVFPLIAYYYNLVTPISIISNILVTYLAGGIVILGFLTLLCVIPMPGLAALFLYPAGALAQFILRTAALCKGAPFGYRVVATPHPLLIAAFYGCLAWLIVWMNGKAKRRNLALPIALLGILCITFAVPPWIWANGKIQVTFIDVGQGDSILIKTPKNHFVLVDGGGSMFSETGRRKVLPYLKHLGINRLAMVINTHPDVDHIKGLVEVMEEMPVQAVGLGEVFLNHPDSADLLEAAQSQKAVIVALEAGQDFNLDGMEMSVWCPERNSTQAESNNENSTVLCCRYGVFTVLLTGDVNEAKLTPLLNRHKGEALTVGKIPHHGSRSSLCPLLYREAECLVLSVGANNTFGHPHWEVLQAVQKARKPLLRTDEHGAVTFISDGKRVKVTTFK